MKQDQHQALNTMKADLEGTQHKYVGPIGKECRLQVIEPEFAKLQPDTKAVDRSAGGAGGYFSQAEANNLENRRAEANPGSPDGGRQQGHG